MTTVHQASTPIIDQHTPLPPLSPLPPQPAEFASARHDPLWDALSAFRVDHGTPALTFERRLARENAWSPAFAERVMREYRRFVYLACRAGHPVTPSDAVDQAWHLHMTYTRSYWEHLCGQVIERPLHHGPTRGGKAEDDKFHDWYTRTLASYERLFGETPPADIWPPAQARFGTAPHFSRVNTADNWVIPKRPLRRTVVGLFASLGLMSAAGCGTLLAPSQGVSPVGPIAIGVLIVLGIGMLVAAGVALTRVTKRASQRAAASTHTRQRTSDTSSDSSGIAWWWFWSSSTGDHHHAAHHAGQSSTVDHLTPDSSGSHSSGGSGSSGGSDASGSSDSSGSSGSSDSGSSGCSSSGCGGGGCGGGGD